MSIVHNTDIYGYKEIWTDIKDYHSRAVEIQKKKTKNKIMKVKRTKYLEYWKPRLKALREDTANKFNRAYIRL